MSASKVSFAKALNTALADAMEASREVVVFGEDVGTLGGVFRITDGLTARFGRERCFDTPLAESGIIGTAVGMAMNGMRPVAEMQFDAFAYPAFEQVASHVAKMHNRTRGRLTMPLVIRIPYGGGVGGVEHHCDSSESYYAHTPGLKVFTPASVRDAYVMLREAVDSPDPVVFFEPKRLYWSTAQVDLDELREQYENGSLPRREGHAVVAREGSDATLISYGPSVPVCLAAAEEAAQDGMSVEVIDLGSVVPYDDETVAASVRKTGRAVVVAEAQGFASVASEIVARTQERCFHSLAAPVLRVTGFDIPYPSPSFEHHHIPSSERILDALDDLQWED
ncbi:transketolase C-terminal domain-containing protein [Glutamicibacter protophormiae]|uniref:3-methyl-2-oxobutanoate dehydrogenase (2-methylpropanoyl-transferring) n=1 Tax=Kocuria varians TaxID=1272 RepID=A0A7D7PSF9_KOCVA|nr:MULTISPECIES: transketolase C-terminal domain-containing protein [Kocuria]MDN5631683.1 alpha-ketoacid dehydrogenase subunit beta [Kocuria sp.]QMS56212.1 3-methyl-2-oxobutanoate dehydrogenase subunit beta [Kocuria varians]WNB88222.1 transketolase C-terminal domain-containing protein [Glutamicibacter protophormiae]